MSAENSPAVSLEKRVPRLVRASDADRDRIADILREAMAEGRLDAEEHAERIEAVFRAKTVGELEPLISDLPAGQRATAQRPAARAPRAEPPVAGFGRSARNMVAVLSGATRHGRWRVGSKINAVAICGGVELDLTEAIFDQRYVVINATAVCGGVDIKVPENVTLRSGGSGILGGFDVEENESPDADAPVVVVQGAAICGGVDAKPVLGKRLRNLRDD